MAQSNSAFDELTSGRFLSIQWVNAFGEVQTISGRFGVTKYQTKPSKPKASKTHITIWTKPRQSKQYKLPRFVKRSSILAIKAGGFTVYCKP